MELELSEDQEFFLETTRKFLAAECPISTVRALEHDPAGFDRRLLATGRRARVDVDARARGRRWRQPQRARPARPRAGGRGDGSAGVARTARARSTWWPARSRRTAPPTQRAAVLPGLLAGEAVAAWCGVTPVDAARSRRRRSCSPARPRRSRRAPRPTHLLVAARTTATASPSSSCRPMPPGVTRHADGRARPRAPLRGGALRRRARCPPSAVVGAVGGRRGRRRAPAADRLRAAVRRDRRRHRPHVRDDPRVPRRPLLVRPAAVVVPGAQAPRRRRQDVARGLPRHRHRRRPGGGRASADDAGRAGERGQGAGSGPTPPSSSRTACSSTAASASPGSTTCTSTCGGPRSTGSPTARPRSTPSASPTEPARARRRDGAVDVEPRRGVPRSGPGAWLADEHAAGRGDRRRAASTTAAGTCERALQRRLWDGGFAGICFPAEYGGLGLTRRAPAGLHRGVAALRHAVLAQRAHVRHPRRHPRRLRHPRAEGSATCRRSSGARSCGCSSCPSRAAAPTSPAASPGPTATATCSS